MDIQVASNLERYIYHAVGACSGDAADPAAVVRAAMGDLAGPARAFTSLPPGLAQQVLYAGILLRV
jgi:hypothetical protein